MTVIYHIARRRDWPPRTGAYRGDTLVSEGFIHCSTAEQLIPVANGLFPGRGDLAVLAIDENRVRSRIVYENLEGGTESFPHIYGPLDREAVLRAVALEADPDGSFAMPAGLVDLQA